MAEPLRARWSRGEVLLGVACVMPGAYPAEVLALAGFDFVLLDRQHGLMGDEAMLCALQAVAGSGAAAVVRVRSNDPSLIGAALDAGADGVIVPLVESRADAEAAARACRYPPEGVRSSGPVRASLLGRGDPIEANRSVVCLALVETRAGVEAIDDICGCPGIDGVMVGFADLALSMGLPVGSDDPALAAAMQRILTAALDGDLVALIGVGTATQAAAKVAEGYRMLLVGTDQGHLLAAATGILGGVRDALGKPAP